jgi:hypothetical protein
MRGVSGVEGRIRGEEGGVALGNVSKSEKLATTAASRLLSTGLIVCKGRYILLLPLVGRGGFVTIGGATWEPVRVGRHGAAALGLLGQVV